MLTVTDTPDEDTFTKAAAELVPLLRAQGPEAERTRRVTDKVIAALVDSGLYSASRPAAYGGDERTLTEFVRASVEIGRGCGATGWTLGIMSACQWMAGLYPRRTTDEIWANGASPRFCAVVAIPEDVRPEGDGVRVSGEWRYATGCQHADYALVGVPVFGDDGVPARPGMGLVPMRELTIKDTWHTTGMRASGSNTLVGQDVFIPGHRILDIIGLDTGAVRPDNEAPLYQAGFAAALILYVIGPFVGMAKAALELTVAQIRTGKRNTFTLADKARDVATVQLQVAEAATKIDTAEFHLLRAAAVSDRRNARHERLTNDERAQLRMDTGWALRQSREAIELLLDAQGASAFAEANPVQRYWRDCETGTRHGMLLPQMAQHIFVAQLCGGDPVVGLL
jgi:3-hydroxy-9,10-secoandrosta-1,3,5(10)-triene-9,17-dione monooxygenase